MTTQAQSANFIEIEDHTVNILVYNSFTKGGFSSVFLKANVFFDGNDFYLKAPGKPKLMVNKAVGLWHFNVKELKVELNSNQEVLDLLCQDASCKLISGQEYCDTQVFHFEAGLLN